MIRHINRCADCALFIGKRIGSKTGVALSRVLCTALFALTYTAATAQSAPSGPNSNYLEQLKGAELRDAYLGQTLDLVYNNVGFAGIAHHTETHNADGTTDYDEGGMTLDGEWTLTGPPGFEDRICYRYAELDPNRKHCFWIFREGKCLYGYSAGWFPSVKSIRPELWRVKGANREDGPSCDIFVS